MVANYAAFYSGNFIASLTALEKILAKRGVAVSYVFPKNAPFSNWGENGKYAENHVIHTVDFESSALAAGLKAMVQSDAKNSHIIIHMHFLDWKAINAVTRVLKRERCMFVVQEHMRADFGLEQEKLSWMQRGKGCIKQMLYKYATSPCRMVGVSDAVYQDLCRIRGTKRLQTYMVRNAIAFDRLDGQQINSFQLDSNHDVVIFGTHFERKGVDLALRAVMKAGNSIRLIILTHNENDAVEKLDVLCPEWRNYAKVFHVVENIQSVYNYALCFISPSRSEAFGYAVVEAAYCDTQVIASDIPGQNSMKCIPGIQWVHTEDTDDLSEALVHCYEMRRDCLENVKKQKQVQKKYIRMHFDVNTWCTEILKVYGMEKPAD